MSVSGGTDKVRYFISAGAYTQDGLFNSFNLPYDVSYSYKRFTIVRTLILSSPSRHFCRSTWQVM